MHRDKIGREGRGAVLSLPLALERGRRRRRPAGERKVERQDLVLDGDARGAKARGRVSAPKEIVRRLERQPRLAASRQSGLQNRRGGEPAARRRRASAWPGRAGRGRTPRRGRGVGRHCESSSVAQGRGPSPESRARADSGGRAQIRRGSPRWSGAVTPSRHLSALRVRTSASKREMGRLRTAPT